MRCTLRRLCEKNREVDQALVGSEAVAPRPAVCRPVEQREDQYTTHQCEIVPVYGPICRADHTVVRGPFTGYLRVLMHAQVDPDPLGAIPQR